MGKYGKLKKVALFKKVALQIEEIKFNDRIKMILEKVVELGCESANTRKSFENFEEEYYKGVRLSNSKLTKISTLVVEAVLHQQSSIDWKNEKRDFFINFVMEKLKMDNILKLKSKYEKIMRTYAKGTSLIFDFEKMKTPLEEPEPEILEKEEVNIFFDKDITSNFTFREDELSENVDHIYSGRGIQPNMSKFITDVNRSHRPETSFLFRLGKVPVTEVEPKFIKDLQSKNPKRLEEDRGVSFEEFKINSNRRKYKKDKVLITEETPLQEDNQGQILTTQAKNEEDRVRNEERNSYISFLDIQLQKSKSSYEENFSSILRKKNLHLNLKGQQMKLQAKQTTIDLELKRQATPQKILTESELYEKIVEKLIKDQIDEIYAEDIGNQTTFLRCKRFFQKESLPNDTESSQSNGKSEEDRQGFLQFNYNFFHHKPDYVSRNRPNSP